MEYGFGIEIEADFNDYVEPKPRNWKVELDGSLGQYGKEFVSRGICKFGDAIRRVDELKNHLDDIDALNKLEMSNSAGVHVHTNVMGMSANDLVKYCTLVLFLEPILVKMCGNQRGSNLFCLPNSVAPVSDYILDFIEIYRKRRQRYGDDEALLDATRYAAKAFNKDIKYGFVNLKTIYEKSSLEFRGLPFLTDFEAVKNWITIINKIYIFSSEDFDLEDLAEVASMGGTEEFLLRVFGDEYEKVEPFVDGDEILDNLRDNLQPLIYLGQF